MATLCRYRMTTDGLPYRTLQYNTQDRGVYYSRWGNFGKYQPQQKANRGVLLSLNSTMRRNRRRTTARQSSSLLVLDDCVVVVVDDVAAARHCHFHFHCQSHHYHFHYRWNDDQRAVAAAVADDMLVSGPPQEITKS